MRYWVYSEGQVLGPYEPQELMVQPWFHRDLRVCLASEGQTQVATWELARDNPEFAVSLMRNPGGAPASSEMLISQTLSNCFAELEKVLVEMMQLQKGLEKTMAMDKAALQDEIKAAIEAVQKMVQESVRQTQKSIQDLSARTDSSGGNLAAKLDAVSSALAPLASLPALPGAVEALRQETANNVQNVTRLANEIDLLRKMQEMKEKEAQMKEARRLQEEKLRFWAGVGILSVLILAVGSWIAFKEFQGKPKVSAKPVHHQAPESSAVVPSNGNSKPKLIKVSAGDPGRASPEALRRGANGASKEKMAKPKVVVQPARPKQVSSKKPKPPPKPLASPPPKPQAEPTTPVDSGPPPSPAAVMAPPQQVSSPASIIEPEATSAGLNAPAPQSSSERPTENETPAEPQDGPKPKPQPMLLPGISPE